MIKLFKNKVDITGVAVLLMAFFVAVGFTVAKEMQQGQWYQVEIDGNPSDPNNQEITGDYPGGAPVFPCDEQDPATVCAIHFEIDDEAPFPSTVAEAEALEAAGDIANVQYRYKL